MPDPLAHGKHSKHKKKVPDVAISPSGSVVKEQEPAREQEAEVLSEIKEASKEADNEALEKVRQEIGHDAKLAHEEVEIGPDLEDHGVKSPEKEARRVLEKGSTLKLPISEEEYKKGEQVKVGGKVIDKMVIGVSSLAALAIWIGRLIKMTHEKTLKVVFRKEGETVK